MSWKLSFSPLCLATACATSWPITAARRSSSLSSSLMRPAELPFISDRGDDMVHCQSCDFYQRWKFKNDPMIM